MRRFFGALLLAAAATAAASCGTTTPTAPVVPEPVLTTDTLDGALTAGGQLYHVIPAARQGQVVMTMQGISDPTVKLGMDIGVYSTLSCVAVMSNPTATIGNQLVGLATGVNSLCVRVYDPGTIPADATVAYQITVSHY